MTLKNTPSSTMNEQYYPFSTPFYSGTQNNLMSRGANALSVTSAGESVGRRKSNARFAQKPMVKLARMAMSVIDRASPSLAARLTYILISSPPRYRPHPGEVVLRASAHRWRIPFQGGWLQCYRWGKGPVCLFVHCWGGRGTQAEAMIRHLTSNGLSVVSFDHPAHGLSSGNCAEMIRMSAATAAVIQNVGTIDTLIGHSLGVAAAAIALRDYDLQVKRFVSISSLTHCTWFTEVIGDYLGISRATVERARRIVDGSYTQPVNWETLSVVTMLARLTMPMLLIHDYDDPEIPFEHSQSIRQAVSHAQFQATRGLGHRRLLKDANVLDLVMQFAQREVAA
jgi:pimeloyl-ACP methyl ester carboxylesterase